MSRPPNKELQLATSQDAEPTRYAQGWRRGKPEEDPEKLKRWGVISAKPSEFLIRMRGGNVTTSGQGATVFKWPWDSVAIVPTTVQRLQFTADQVTSEKVGVKVTGIVVYRIAEPLIAFRMLNFSFPERAQEKLATMMEEMCIGATRRLVANLTVEECLTRRKDALASELVREVAPVVSGSGQLEDTTTRGWGLIVDTIEIQDVRITSAQVFANMQARFRQEQERVAREAELVKLRSIKLNEASTEQEVELSRVAAQTEIRRKKQAAEEEAKLEKITGDARVEEQRLAQERLTRANQVSAEREFQLARIQAEQEVRQRKQLADEAAALEQQQAAARLAEAKQRAQEKQALDQQLTEARLTQERLRHEVEVARLEAEAEQARHAARVAEELQQAELMRTRADVAEAKRQLTEIEAKTVELEVQKQQLLAKLELDRLEKLKEIENTLSPEAIQLAVAHKLPELAQAFQQKMGEVHVTAVDGANPFGYIAAAVEGVMGLARSAGLEVPKKPTS
jgi:regulator of protease activity HflC (stomatin/prohibitin superfamily)